MSTRDWERETFEDLDDVIADVLAELRATREERDALRALFGEPIGVVMRGREGKPIWGTAEDVRHPIPAFHIPLYALNTEPERDE